MGRFYRRKAQWYRSRGQLIQDPHSWWANGRIICNERSSQFWGEQFLCQLKHLLIETCRSRADGGGGRVADCEFFVNKRDHPQLKRDLSEPYDFLFPAAADAGAASAGAGAGMLGSYAPVLSFYCSERFADIPFPSAIDWETATGRVFPPHGNEMYTKSNSASADATPWESRTPTAFFRGTATGGGVSTATNQRLEAARLSQLWAAAPPPVSGDEGERASDYSDTSEPPLLDAELTSWNFRDKISPDQNCMLRFIQPPASDEPGEGGAGAAGLPRLPRAVPDLTKAVGSQARYKYLLYIEGHCAACRYTYMLSTGSLILRVLPSVGCPAPDLWYFPLLKPYVDHVPVKPDLSDLAEVIRWCRDNDDECRKIAQAGHELHAQYLSEEGTLDYSAMVLAEIGSRFDYTAESLAAVAEQTAALPVTAPKETSDGGDPVGSGGAADEEAQMMAMMGLPCSFQSSVTKKRPARRKNQHSGGGGGGGGGTRAQKQRICFDFQRQGYCERGEGCRFVHDALSAGFFDDSPADDTAPSVTASGGKRDEVAELIGQAYIGPMLPVFAPADPGTPPAEGEVDQAELAARWAVEICDSKQAERVRHAKDRFESMDSGGFRRARKATNALECLGAGPFVCRSALKLVEMDALFALCVDGYQPPQPGTLDGSQSPPEQAAAAGGGLLTFVDLCGGPGGFTEYLTSSRLNSRGWGITLKIDDGCDWQIQSTENFTISYGADGTGNLFDAANMRHFASVVLQEATEGVTLVVADGGFAEARDRHDQETIMQRLVLCQIAAMLMVLKKGGAFVLKLFEMQTPLTASLYFLLHTLFEQTTVAKPVTSRPASSERYIVCRGEPFHMPFHISMCAHSF